MSLPTPDESSLAGSVPRTVAAVKIGVVNYPSASTTGVWSFEVDDPAAVRLGIRARRPHADIVWVISRELLAEGIEAEEGVRPTAGEPTGDVRLWTFADHLFITVKPPGAEAVTLTMSRETVAKFLADSYQLMSGAQAEAAIADALDGFIARMRAEGEL